MVNIKFNILKRVGTISKNSHNLLLLCLISWNNAAPKYDLRKWGDDGNKPYKGVTLTKDELLNLYTILCNAKLKNKSTLAKNEITLGNANALIYDVFGEYKSSNSMPGKVLYMSWGGGNPKYDIRQWKGDFSACGKGVSLTEDECESLINIIKNELRLSEEEEFDTADFDTTAFEDLFL